MKSISELKSEALSSLNEKWGISVGCTLIFFVIGIALSLIPYIGDIASILVSGALSLGLCNFFLLVSKSENVEIIFNQDALEEISHKAFIINSEIENIGARRLHTVMSKLLNEILFDIPEKIGPNAKVVITKKMVIEKLDSITQNKDLSEYIL